MGTEFTDTCFSYTLNGFSPYVEDPKPHFTYAAVDSESYDISWCVRSEGERWQKRWLMAFPGIAIAAVKTVYHLAKLILLEIPKALVKRQKSLTAHTFYIARDLQELSGRFLSFFNVQLGQYYIECSAYHKTCYDLYFAK